MTAPALANLQCIIDEGTPAWEKLEGVNTGASVKIEGELVESPGKGQKWEVRAKDMAVFGLADPESFPLQKKRHSDEFLRTIAHLAVRAPTNMARPSASVPTPRLRYTTIFAIWAFSMCIRPFLPDRTAKARGKCSA